LARVNCAIPRRLSKSKALIPATHIAVSIQAFEIFIAITSCL
jgi:hypothetical protein